MNYYSGPNPAPYGNGYGAPPPYPPPYRQYYTPPPNPWYRPIRRSANIICFGLIIIILLGELMLPVFMEFANLFISGLDIVSPEMLSLIDMSCGFVVYVIMFIIPLAIIRVWIGIPSRVAFPMRTPGAATVIPAVFVCLGASVLGILTYGVITGFLESFFYVKPYMTEVPDPIGIPAMVIYFARLTVGPAILEELMFRGVIMQSLRRFGDSYALICSSIVFSLAHHNLVQGPNAMILGIVIGFFVLRTGSLKTGMILHFVNNFLIVLLDFALKDMPARESNMMTMLVLAFYSISGLICFALLLIKRGGIFYLAPSDYPVSMGRKYSLFFINAAPIIYIIIVVLLTLVQFQPVYMY